MRLFIAAYPPPEACGHLAGALATLNVTAARARLAKRENWHITLAFLGEVPDERATEAASALRVAMPPAEVRLAGGGRFHRGAFTVLWVGVQGEGLVPLATAVRKNLKKCRLPYDRKPFTPHLTIARPGDRLPPDAIAADRAALAAYAGPTWPVARIELVRSHLGPNPGYDHLAAHDL